MNMNMIPLKGARHKTPSSINEHDMNHEGTAARIVRVQRMGDWETLLAQARRRDGPLDDRTRGQLKASLKEAIGMLLQYPAADDQDGQRLETAKDEFCYMVKRIVQGPDVNGAMYGRLWNGAVIRQGHGVRSGKIWPIRFTPKSSRLSRREGRTGSRSTPAILHLVIQEPVGAQRRRVGKEIARSADPRTPRSVGRT